jgi:signal transduction histidine kinase
MQHPNSQERLSQIILIAEDDPALAEAIAATLDLKGLETVLANNGGDALSKARKLQPGLILLDVMMPGMTGIEVCETLKADPETAAIPVIFITAKAQPADRSRGLAAGASAYLTKPFSPTQLISLVDELLVGEPHAARQAQSDLAAMPANQLVIYARELKMLFEQERKERAALENAHKRLDELDRLKAAFLSTVTHELLTPFANIGLPLQIMQRQIDSFSPEQRDTLESLATEIAQLHRLINGVVKFAALVNKQREPRPGRIALDRIIPPAVQPVAILARAREVDFRVFLSPDISQVYADPVLLGEAVFQMAHNAIKFNFPGGSARTRVREENGWVIIEVQDTGTGLTPERLAILGQPFEQSADALRRGQEGLGIGWAFVSYVAEVHGGRTRVESAGPRQGSTFSLALPAANDEVG